MRTRARRIEEALKPLKTLHTLYEHAQITQEMLKGHRLLNGVLFSSDRFSLAESMRTQARRTEEALNAQLQQAEHGRLTLTSKHAEGILFVCACVRAHVRAHVRVRVRVRVRVSVRVRVRVTVRVLCLCILFALVWYVCCYFLLACACVCLSCLRACVAVIYPV